MLVDYQIHNLAKTQGMITPYDESHLQPCSYDITLDGKFLALRKDEQSYIDLRFSHDDLWYPKDVDVLYIEPHECVLAQTRETFNIPDDVCARVEGKSSLGRYFLTNHITAGFIDNGFQGTITLELCNNFPYTIELTAGMLIGQVCFFQTKKCKIPYHGKYQGQRYPTESRYYMNGE